MLQWEHKHSQEFEGAAEYVRTTGYMPDMYLDRPHLTDLEEWYWEAYSSLANSRSVGLAIGPIPLSEIVAYCDLIGLKDLDERFDLSKVVRRLDCHALKLYGDKNG